MDKKRIKACREAGVMNPTARLFEEEIFEKVLPSSGDALPFSNRSWERLRYQGMLMKDWVTKDMPAYIPEGTREMYWRRYKATCAAEGGWIPWLIYLLEPRWAGTFERKRPRRPKGKPLFDDLPLNQRARAQAIFNRLCDQSLWSVADWHRPILAGVARRLARNPYNCSSAWGKKMRRIKGGIHVQRR
jgi:hypothetical protein